MGIAYLLLILATVACGHQPKSEPEGPLQAATGAYEAAAERALTFLDGTGFVVSRRGNEEIHHGDSLLFTGLLVASLDCERGRRPSQAMLEMPPEFWRHRILAGQPVSLDQALGAYLGIAFRIRHCGEAERWRAFLDDHRRVGGPDVPKYFDYVRDRLFEEAGVTEGLTPRVKEAARADNRRKLELEVGAWAAAVKATKAACYRINLGLIAFETLELLGDTVGGGEFCANTRGLGLAHVEHWCGREGLQSFINNFVVNEYQYKFQRCPAWESPDGNGNDHPGIDLLRALSYTSAIPQERL